MGFRLGSLQNLLPPWGMVGGLMRITAHGEQILRQVGTQPSLSLSQYILTILHCRLNTPRRERHWKRGTFTTQISCLISKLIYMLIKWWNWKGPGTVERAVPSTVPMMSCNLAQYKSIRSPSSGPRLLSAGPENSGGVRRWSPQVTETQMTQCANAHRKTNSMKYRTTYSPRDVAQPAYHWSL